MKRIICFLALLVMLENHFVSADVPQTMNVQGRVKDASGALINGNRNVIFRIYDVATGGTVLWEETVNNLRFTQGLFVVCLGDPSRTPARPLNLPFDKTYWLGITIVGGGAELSPRIVLCSSPYSLNAKAVLGSTSTSNIFPGSGNVGIGTLTPAGKLHIEDVNWSNAPFLIKGRSGAVTGPAITVDATTGTGGRKYSLISTNSGAGAGGGKLAIYDDTPGSAGYRMVIDSDGDVGIGTTAPTTKLHVNSRIAAGVNGSTAGAMTFFPPDGFAWFHIDNGPAGGRPAGRLRISTGGNPGDNEMMSILQTGNIGIGTTTPRGKLEIRGTGAGTSGVALRADNTNASGIGILSTTNSNDANIVATNTGTGDLLRGFSGSTAGNLVFRVTNSGRTVTSVLEITGGSDISEQFDVTPNNAEESKVDSRALEPGMVVTIDPQNPGKLMMSTTAYDRKVAGIISGANGINTGMMMGQNGSAAAGSTPVALAGRVYCWVDASHGAIEPGDLLTTSYTPGHAMKVSDHVKAQGAILGKAMTSLANGNGLVLVLVTLQ